MDTIGCGKSVSPKDMEIPYQLIKLMLPLIVGNILQQFYNTADAFVVGRFADELSFAGVGIASSVMNMFLFAIVGACSGISVMFSQYYGAKDIEAFRNEHFLTFTFGSMISIALSITGIIMLSLILNVIQVPYELDKYVKSYLAIVFLGLPASYIYNLCNAILRSVGRTGVVMAILTVSVAVNLGVDIILVWKFNMGIKGAALATVLSQMLSAVLSYLYILKKQPELMFKKCDCKVNINRLRKTGKLAGVTGLHQTGLYIGKLLVQGVINTAGTSVISAYTATTRIEGFANSFGDSGAAATSVIVAQNVGENNRDRVKHTYKWSFIILAILGVVCSLVMYATAGMTTSLLIGKAYGQSYENAVEYLKIISMFYVLCFTGNTYAGYFDGIGKVHIPFIGAVSHITMRIILTYFMIRAMKLKAVAIATGIGWVYVNILWEIIRRKTYNKKYLKFE